MDATSAILIIGGVFYEKNRQPKKVNLCVIRIDKNCNLQMAKPCVHCLKQIKQLNIINKIYYSTGNGEEIVSEKASQMTTSHISKANRHLKNILIKHL